MGNRRITLVDLARHTGLSVSTVSVALRGEPGVSEANRAQVADAAARLGYHPDRSARSLREARSRLIGVTFWLHQTFHTALVEELYTVLLDSPYDLVLSGTTDRRPVAAAIDSLRRDRCDAILLISPELSTHGLAALGEQTPTVVVASDVMAPGVDLVRSDDTIGMRMVLEHLALQGHSQICFVDGGDAAMGPSRRAAYLTAAQELGIEPDVLAGYPTEDAGVQAAGQLMERPEVPTAVVTHNDMVATGLLLTLRARGLRVPQDISVAGYDDTRLAALSTIDLTSASQQPQLLAAQTLERVMARLDGATPEPDGLVVPPRLVVRSTTGPVSSRER